MRPFPDNRKTPLVSAREAIWGSNSRAREEHSLVLVHAETSSEQAESLLSILLVFCIF